MTNNNYPVWFELYCIRLDNSPIAQNVQRLHHRKKIK